MTNATLLNIVFVYIKVCIKYDSYLTGISVPQNPIVCHGKLTVKSSHILLVTVVVSPRDFGRTQVVNILFLIKRCSNSSK